MYVDTIVNSLFSVYNAQKINYKQASVSLIGGNSSFTIIDRKHNDYEVEFQFQRYAFEATVKFSSLLRSQGINSTVTVVLDHIDPIEHFLGTELIKNNKGKPVEPRRERYVSKNKKKGYKLSDLNPKLSEPFCKVLENYDIAPNDIRLLFEYECRIQAMGYYNNKVRNAIHGEKNHQRDHLLDIMINKVSKTNNVSLNANNEACETGSGNKCSAKVSCKGVTSRCIAKAVQYAGLKNDQKGLFIGVWGADRRRCDINIIEGGSALANALWISNIEIKNIFLKSLEEDYVQNIQYSKPQLKSELLCTK
ncbi:MAG: hypothetical protein AAFZ15_34375 [Bacteroidota bacterium]